MRALCRDSSQRTSQAGADSNTRYLISNGHKRLPPVSQVDRMSCFAGSLVFGSTVPSSHVARVVYHKDTESHCQARKSLKLRQQNRFHSRSSASTHSVSESLRTCIMALRNSASMVLSGLGLKAQVMASMRSMNAADCLKMAAQRSYAKSEWELRRLSLRLRPLDPGAPNSPASAVLPQSWTATSTPPAMSTP